MTTPDPLPDDLAVLRALVLTAWAERDAERAEKGRLVEERDQLAGQNDRLRHLLRQLQRMQFGRRSEKLDPDQFTLALEDLEQAVAQGEAEQEKADPALRNARSEKRRVGRGPLPEHLPRVEIVLELEDTACPCCGGTMHVIGEDRSQRLDVIPAQHQVIVTRRPKYACRACQEAVVQVPAPARLIEGGLPTERLVAHVAVAKYADHCPLYRQAQILARQGIAIDRATLAFWAGYAAAEVKPVWIDGATGMGRLLSPLLRALPAPLDGIPTAARERVAGNVLDLIATALLPLSEAPSAGMTLVRVKLWIETHLGEALTAERISGACRMSVRHLNRLFRREGTSLMHHVWERRLALCHRDLTDPAMRNRSITDIAFAAGFNDLSHFSRAYRARYGCPASESRRD